MVDGRSLSSRTLGNNTMAITRINHFESHPDREVDLKAFLTSIIALVRSAPGCQSCQLLEAIETPCRFVILEIWDSVEAHHAAAKLVPPDKLRQVMPLLAAPPVGSYFSVVTAD